MSEQPAVRRIEERRVFSKPPFVEVFDDEVEVSGGRRTQYHRVVEGEGRPGVVILAVCDGEVGLVRTYRYAIGSWEWALPRGYGHGDDPEGSARAEAQEELGRDPDELVALGQVHPNTGILATEVHVFLARYEPPAPVQPDDVAEVAEIRWLTIEALQAEIAEGAITDGITLSALLLAQVTGRIGA